MSLPLIFKGQCQFGVKGGYNYYWFTHPEDGHFNSKYNYNNSAVLVCATIKQRVSNILYFGAELDYTNRSFEVISGWGGLGSGKNADLNYNIGNIYSQIKPQLIFGSKVKFFIYPGFYAGTMIHSSLTGEIKSWSISAQPINTTEIIDGTAKDYYPSFEFGICAGTGIDYMFYKNLGFVLEYNFNMNLLPISNSWGSDKVKMINMNISAGITYTISRKH